MNIKIRNAKEQDLATIVKFNAAMAFETEGKKLELDILTEGVRTCFENPQKGFYFVAEADNGEIIGQTLITTEWSDWRNRDFWWIQSVYVREDWRRKGVFKSLYDHVVSLAQNEPGVYGIRLYVEKENAIAQKTYQNLGMSLTSYLFYEIEL